MTFYSVNFCTKTFNFILTGSQFIEIQQRYTARIVHTTLRFVRAAENIRYTLHVLLNSPPNDRVNPIVRVQAMV